RSALADLDEPQLRWMPAHQLHLTLAFYGEVDREAADEVRAHLGDELGGTGSLQLQLRAAGTFGQRVLWVGVGGETERLQLLMAAAAGAPGHVQEHRPHPHVTIARARRHHKEDLETPARQLAGYGGPNWTADTTGGSGPWRARARPRTPAPPAGDHRAGAAPPQGRPGDPCPSARRLRRTELDRRQYRGHRLPSGPRSRRCARPRGDGDRGPVGAFAG